MSGLKEEGEDTAIRESAKQGGTQESAWKTSFPTTHTHSTNSGQTPINQPLTCLCSPRVRQPRGQRPSVCPSGPGSWFLSCYCTGVSLPPCFQKYTKRAQVPLSKCPPLACRSQGLSSLSTARSLVEAGLHPRVRQWGNWAVKGRKHGGLARTGKGSQVFSFHSQPHHPFSLKPRAMVRKPEWSIP